MSATTTSSRIALAPLSTSKLNINQHSKSKSFNGFSKSSFFPRSNSNHEINSSSFKTSTPSIKRTLDISHINRVIKRSNTDIVQGQASSSSATKQIISPKMERARNLKLKLQLAYYKVKTNQTDVPLIDLKLPAVTPTKMTLDRRAAQIHQQNSNAMADLLAASTPLLLKKKKIIRKAGRSLSVTNINSKRSVSFMDDIVKKRATCANLKRASLIFNSVKEEEPNSCTSAPASITSFNLSLPTPETASSTSSKPINNNNNNGSSSSSSNNNNNPLRASNQTSPSKFLFSRPTYSQCKAKLPPIPKVAINSAAITPESPSSETFSSNVNALLLPLPQPHHQHTESDSTILQNNSSLLVTPIAKSKSFSAASSSLRKKNSHADGDETQLLSSPTRLLSTPSSIGAARCLLQLAKR